MLGLLFSFTIFSITVHAGKAYDYSKYVVDEIKVGGSVTVTTTEYGRSVIRFSPENDGYYEFYTDEIHDTYIDLYEEDTDYRGYIEQRRKITDDGYRCHIISAYFEKGHNYYLHPYVIVDKEDGSGCPVTLYCVDESKDIYNYCVGNGVNTSYAYLKYTGKPLNYSDIVLKYIRSKSYPDIPNPEYGKDWYVAGYCDRETFKRFDNSNGYNGIAWKNGQLTERGDYVIKIVGKGDYINYTYLKLSVMTDIDLRYIDPIILSSSKQTIKVDDIRNTYYIFRPSETKKYTITIRLIMKNGDKYHFYKKLNIYDKNGNLVENEGSGEFEGVLQAGETYYLCIDFSSNNDWDIVYIDFPEYVYKYDPSDKKVTTPKTDPKTKKKNNPEDKKKNNNQDVKTKNSVPLKKGKTFTINKTKYKVIVSKKGNYQVSVVKCNNKKIKKINVAASVKYKGVTYKITSIGANAYSGCSKATSITIGKNVKSIGAKAFYKCSKVKKINVKSKVLKKIGKDAFKGISKKAKVTGSKKIKL